MSDNKLQELEQRVEQLEEQYRATDDNGRQATVSSLIDQFGLTRRQALYAVGLVAMGAAVPQAVLRAVGTAQAQSSDNVLTGIQQIGRDDDRVDTLYVDTVNEQNTIQTDQVDTDSLVTDRIGNAQFPDVVVHRDGADAVAIDTSDGSEISRQDKTTGKGHYDVLQAAVDTLPSSGGHVYIRTGTYTTDDADSVGNVKPLFLVRTDNVRITGDGPATVLTVENGSTPTDEGNRIIHVGGDDTSQYNGTNAYDGFVLQDLKIDGNQQNNGGTGDGDTITNTADGHNLQIQGADFIVSNVHSINSTGDGVEPISRGADSEGDPQAKDGLVVDCIFRDNYEQNVHIHGGKNILVDSCVMDGEHNNSNVSLYSDNTEPCIDITFHNCDIINSTTGGMRIDSGTNTPNVVNDNIRILDCLVKNNANFGIRWVEEAIDRAVIRDTDIVGNGPVGIDGYGGARNITIDGGSVREHDEDGILIDQGVGSGPITDVRIKNVLIEDNDQDNNNRDGIRIVLNGGDLQRLFIDGNDIMSPGTATHRHGIGFQPNSAPSTNTDVYIRRNTVVGDGSGPYNNVGSYATAVGENNPRVTLDVRGLEAEAGNEAYHDGTNSNTVGPAFYDGSASAWKSLVDGTTIS